MRVRSPRGFSLIEVVVASSILLLTCVAVSGALNTVAKANGSIACRSRLEAVADEECERLVALPFWRCVVCTSSAALEPTSLVAQVFPHARPTCNTATAFFCPAAGSGEPSSFVSMATVQGVRVRTVAMFLAASGAASAPLPANLPPGWAVWADGSSPPATTLAVCVEASQAGRTVTRHLQLTEARPSVEPSSGAPSPAPDGAGSG